MPETTRPNATDLYLDILAAAMLLTRIPVAWPEGEEPRTARSYWAFGLIGLGVAALPAMLAAVLISAGAPALAAAALLMALIAVLTGGMHQDGLADVADSLGGRDPSHRLTIMHDSSIGSFGTVGLITTSVISLASIAGLAAISVEAMVGGVLAAATLSRAMMAVQRSLHEPPTAKGLASLTGKPDSVTSLVAVLISLVIALIFTGLASAFLMLLVGLAVTYGLGRFLQGWIGGVNGDGLGATQQLSEAAMLLALITALA